MCWLSSYESLIATTTTSYISTSFSGLMSHCRHTRAFATAVILNCVLYSTPLVIWGWSCLLWFDTNCTQMNVNNLIFTRQTFIKWCRRTKLVPFPRSLVFCKTPFFISNVTSFSCFLNYDSPVSSGRCLIITVAGTPFPFLLLSPSTFHISLALFLSAH